MSESDGVEEEEGGGGGERSRNQMKRRTEDHENDGVDGAREGDRYCRRIRRLRSIGWQGGRPAIT